MLAISSTAYDVIISPKAISERQAALDEARTEAQEKGEDTADYDWNVEDVICGNLASILAWTRAICASAVRTPTASTSAWPGAWTARWRTRSASCWTPTT